MTPDMSKLYFSTLMILRVLICKILSTPWSFIKKAKNNDQTTNNMKSCCSIICHALYNYFSTKTTKVKDNQEQLDKSDQI